MPEDKDVKDFLQMADNLELEGHVTRAEAMRHLIKRVQRAEERLYFLLNGGLETRKLQEGRR